MKVEVVEVILQAENVLQPSVLVQAYNLLQVRFSFSQDQNNYEPIEPLFFHCTPYVKPNNQEYIGCIIFSMYII